MIANKLITKLCIAIMAILVCLCFGLILFNDKFGAMISNRGTNMEYESKIFNTDQVISINVIMDDEQWNDMLENAMSEKYYRCDVEINGEVFQGVGIRPKGNTSLTSIANDPTTNRYSFKLEFDQFVDGQNYYGLDKLVLNNSYADNTNMKEALIYDMYKFIGADSPLYNYAKISVNGKYWGMYLALEAIEDSFLLRNYSTASGKLYKPDSLGVGNGPGGFGMNGNMVPPGNFNRDENLMPPNIPGMNEPMTPHNNSNVGENMVPPDNLNTNEQQNQTNGNQQPFDRHSLNVSERENGGHPMGMRENGSNLNYIDDNLDSYSTIWEGSVTDSNNSDHIRVVEALRNISQNTSIEKYMDIENIIKYMAVHVFSVNEDSLSGSMAHNYYLYEYDGRLNMIPWDYNLIFGGMRGGDANSIVNDPIDMPFSITNFFNPLLMNRKYSTMYYESLSQLVEKYINGGAFDKFYNRTRNLIDSLVKTDPNAFVDYETYEKAADTLYNVVKLRGESILGQINGTVPSTSDNQKKNPENLIDASHIDINSMGVMNMGREENRDRSQSFDLNQQNTINNPTNPPNDIQNTIEQNINNNLRNMQPHPQSQNNLKIDWNVLLISIIVLLISFVLVGFFKKNY